MPSKKRKYNARFPAGRIKRIMQADEEVGKIAQAVPVIISRTLELFVESLLTKSSSITNQRNAKTLSTSHLKQCIMSESRFDFLKDLVKTVPDIGQDDQQQQDAIPSTSSNGESNGGQNHRLQLQRSQSLQPAHISAPSTSTCTSNSSIQYHQLNQQKQNFQLNKYYTTQQRTNNSQTRISRTHSFPATVTITSNQQQNSTLTFPIQIPDNIDDDDPNQLESPAVKIDYSNFTLPATSPSIKIDLSNFSQLTKTTTPTPASTSSTSSTTATTNLDEDYDDV